MSSSDSIREVQEAESEAKRMLERSVSSKEAIIARARLDAQKMLAGVDEEASAMRNQYEKKSEKATESLRKEIIAKAVKEAAALSRRRLSRQKEKKAVDEAISLVLK